MKSMQSKITLGIVCIFLGFMTAIQFKTYNNPSTRVNTNSFDDLAKQIETLKKQKTDLTSKVNDLQSKVNKYEESFTSSSEEAKKMDADLKNVEKLAGLTDVEGPGVIITLSPPNDLTSANTSGINSLSILDVINELNASGAEAISINEERYVSRTQVREAGSAIKINGTAFSPNKNFVIKAIGDAKVLEGAFNLPGGVKDTLKEYGIVMGIAQQKNIKILKYEKNIEYDYAKEAR